MGGVKSVRKWKSNLQEEGGHFLWGPKMCSLGLLAAFRVQIADSIRIEITFVANGLTGPTVEEPYCVNAARCHRAPQKKGVSELRPYKKHRNNRKHRG